MTITEISTHYNVASSLVSKWKCELINNAANAFEVKTQKTTEVVEQKLYSQIGKLTIR